MRTPRRVCATCGRRVSKSEIHHVAGRHNDPAPGPPLCVRCHRKAGDRLQALGARLEADADRGDLDCAWAAIVGVVAMVELLGESHPDTTTTGATEAVALINVLGAILRSEAADGWAPDPTRDGGPRPRYNDAYAWRNPGRRYHPKQHDSRVEVLASLLGTLRHAAEATIGDDGGLLAVELELADMQDAGRQLPATIDLPDGMTSDQVGDLLAAAFVAARGELLMLWSGDDGTATPALGALLRTAELWPQLLALILAGGAAEAARMLAEMIATIEDAVHDAG